MMRFSLRFLLLASTGVALICWTLNGESLNRIFATIIIFSTVGWTIGLLRDDEAIEGAIVSGVAGSLSLWTVAWCCYVFGYFLQDSPADEYFEDFSVLGTMLALPVGLLIIAPISATAGAIVGHAADVIHRFLLLSSRRSVMPKPATVVDRKSSEPAAHGQ